jgi:nicotinamide phosphoribosyltransferase
MRTNLILMSDSYKYSQFNQYPPGTEIVRSYVESRGGIWDDTVFFGIQMFIQEYLSKPITQADIDQAEKLILAHGEPFYKEGWEYILSEYNGMIPLKIKAVPEGTVLPYSNVLAVVENTDPKCWWVTSFFETAILRAIWYGTTVATNSFESKKLLLEALEETGTPEAIDFMLHDFGARGVSSGESAMIGGLAHLVNFLGTDNVEALQGGMEYYAAEGPVGFSIPAMEHSTVTSWGKDGEADSFRNHLKLNGAPGAPIAFVSDSYDIFNACENIWGKELKQEVIDSGAIVVVRPDSGDPASVVTKCLKLLAKQFGWTKNDKGYKVLNNVKVIQGDGIDHASIRSILFSTQMAGFSTDNLAFGQGGALLQQVNRDTMRFAMKCSAIRVNGEWRDVFKDPVTDSGKVSKKGLVTLFQATDGSFISEVEGTEFANATEALLPIYDHGAILNQVTFDQVRANAQVYWDTRAAALEAKEAAAALEAA